MDRNLRIRMLLEAGDKVSRPLREIGASSSKTAQALKATRDRLKEIERAQSAISGFRELKAGLRTTEADLTRTQQRVHALAREVAATDSPTKKLANDFTKAKREAATLGTEFERQSIELQRMRDRLKGAGVATTNLAADERRLRAEAARTTTTFAEQERRLTRLTERSRRMSAAREAFGGRMNTATGLAAGGASSIGTGIAAGAPIVAVSRDAMNLEDVMADVRKVVNFDTPKQFEQMREQVIALSTVLPMTAQGIGQIVAAGGRSGLQRNELLAFATDAAKMGIAFDMSADDAGTMMATWRTAFNTGRDGVRTLGDQVNALTNKFGGNVVAVNGIVTRIGPLGKVAGTASSEIAALAQMMAKLGLEEDVGATGIKNMLLALSRGAATTPHASAAFKQLGLDATKVAKSMQKDAGGTILDVFRRLSKLDAADRPGVMTRLFGRESIAAIAPLLTSLPQLEKNFALVGDKTAYAGSMEREYASRAATTSNAVQLADNNFTALKITVGTMLLPTIISLSQWFGRIMQRMRSFAAAHPGLAKGIVLVAAVTSALLVVLGGMGIVLAGLIGPFAVLDAGLVAVGVAGGIASIGLLPILGTIALIVAGVAALAGAAYLIYSYWEPIKRFFSGIWNDIKVAFDGGLWGILAMLWKWNVEVLKLFGTAFGKAAAWLMANLPSILSGVWSVLKFCFVNGFALLPMLAIQFGVNTVRGLITGIGSMLGALKSAVVNAASSAAKWFKEKLGIHSPSRVFMGFGTHIMAGLTNGIAGGEDGPVRRIDRLSRRLTSAMAVGAALSPVAAPVYAASAAHGPAGAGGGGASGARHYEIHIHAAPGMDEKNLADLVARKIEEADRGKSAARRASFADDPDWSHSA